MDPGSAKGLLRQKNFNFFVTFRPVSEYIINMIYDRKINFSSGGFCQNTSFKRAVEVEKWRPFSYTSARVVQLRY